MAEAICASRCSLLLRTGRVEDVDGPAATKSSAENTPKAAALLVFFPTVDGPEANESSKDATSAAARLLFFNTAGSEGTTVLGLPVITADVFSLAETLAAVRFFDFSFAGIASSAVILWMKTTSWSNTYYSQQRSPGR